MTGVFISYRREDCAGHAGRLYDRLAEQFGEQRVFMDIDALEPGVDFAERIAEAVGASDVVLALIGTRWLQVSDAGGRRRLEDPGDFVRLELAAALERPDVRVIPVLVQGASMPSADELPEDLQDLARRHAIELSDARWAHDVGRLTSALQRDAAAAGSGSRSRIRALAPRRSRLLAVGGAVTAGIVAALVVLLSGGDGGGEPIVGPVSVGREAGKPAVGAGHVWVPIGTKGAVARVNPQELSHELIANVGDYPASADSADGVIWVADSGGDQVFRIDASGNAQVSQPIDVGDEPNDIAVGEGYVWTADCACESKATPYSVSRIDPDTLDVKHLRVSGSPLGIGVGAGKVWVATANGTVQRIDPVRGEVDREPIPVGESASDVVVDRFGIWVAVQEPGMVVRIDPQTLKPESEIPVGTSPHTLALGGGYLWIADDVDGRLRRLDTSRGELAGAGVIVGEEASGVAFGEGRAWVVNHGPGELLGVAP